jgi:hypothetical protein
MPRQDLMRLIVADLAFAAARGCAEPMLGVDRHRSRCIPPTEPMGW